ncbi:MAG: hypothetical protein IK008_03610 [Bacteroidales bacterium]|nr:hypothetical protein [Bacteroidales bacterium]
MKKLIYILMSALVAFLVGSCSPAEIRQAKVMTQAEIDEYNKQFKDGEEPENPDPENPDPENPDPENPNPGDPGPTDPTGPITDYFVGESAKGLKDGSSWDNCADIATLRALIAQKMNGTSQDNEAAYAQAAILDGAKIHLTGGKFVLPDAEAKVVKLEWNGYGNPVKLFFYGGYNPASTGTDLSDRNKDSYETVLSGDLNGNDTVEANDARILLLGNQTELSFDGITFAHAYVAGNGGALTLSAGSSGTSSVNLNNCTFRNNATDANSSGAAIMVQKGELEVQNSTFNDNGAKNGAVFFLSNDSAKLKVSNSSFYGNTVSNCGGVMNQSKGKAEFKACRFEYNRSNGYAGGVMHVNGAGTSLLCDGCQFYDNEASQHGAAVSLEQGTVRLVNCQVFYNQSAVGKEGSASHGGAVAILKANGEMHISNSEFKENESKGNASAVYMNQGRLYINNTKFVNNKADNRGALRLNNGLCYMNKVSVNGSSVEKEWGLAIQCTSLGALCMNNVTLGNSKGTIGDKNPTLNGTFNGLIVNSTIVDNSPLSMLRVEGSKKQVLLNSMLVNLAGGCSIYYAGDDEVTSLGSCIIGGIMGNDSATRVYNAGTGDVTGVDYTTLGFTWNDSNGIYTWNGTAPGHTPIDASSIEGLARTALPITVSGSVDDAEVFKVSNVSDDFCNWVNDVNPGAFAKDALEHARSGNATCGAWQKQ